MLTRTHTHGLTKPQQQTKSPQRRAGIGQRDGGQGPLTALPCLRGRTGQKREPAIGSSAQHKKEREDVR